MMIRRALGKFAKAKILHFQFKLPVKERRVRMSRVESPILKGEKEFMKKVQL